MLKRVVYSILTGIATGSLILNIAVLIFIFAGNSGGASEILSDYIRQLVLCCVVGVAFNMADVISTGQRRFAVELTVGFARAVLTFFICAFIFEWIIPSFINIVIYAGVCVFATGLFILCNFFGKILKRKSV